MIGHIQIEVKFRGFGVTFGTLKRRWAVALPFEFHPEPSGEVPVFAKKLLDERGIKIHVWI